MTDSFDQSWTKDEPFKVLNNNDNNDNNYTNNQTDIKSVEDVVAELVDDELFMDEEGEGKDESSDTSESGGGSQPSSEDASSE